MEEKIYTRSEVAALLTILGVGIMIEMDVKLSKEKMREFYDNVMSDLNKKSTGETPEELLKKVLA